MQLIIEIPDEFVALLADPGFELSKVALEAIGIEAYRQHRLSEFQLRTLLGIPSRFELDAFLKEHQVDKYTFEDFEHDLARIREARTKPKTEQST